MPNEIQPIGKFLFPFSPRSRGGGKTDSTVNIFTTIHIHDDPQQPAAHIAPALISIEDLTVLANTQSDRHPPSNIPYQDENDIKPHYLEDYIDLVPSVFPHHTGGGVDRRA